MSKGSPGGILGAHSPSWGDSTALFSVPWGKDFKSLLYCMWWLPKKLLHRTFLQSFFLWCSLCLCFFVKCLFFLCAIFPCLSITLSKTLCLLKSDMFVATTWQGRIISGMLPTVSLLLQGIATEVPLTDLFITDPNHISMCLPFTLCPTLPPFLPSIAYILSPLTHSVLCFLSSPH